MEVREHTNRIYEALESGELPTDVFVNEVLAYLSDDQIKEIRKTLLDDLDEEEDE